MITLQKITVPGVPEAKPRPRVGRFKNIYTPKTKGRFEQRVAKAYVNDLLTGPVCLTLEFVFPLMKSWPKKKKLMLMGEAHCSKPDIDNLVKAAMDGMNGKAYSDDCQVVKVKASKRYANEDEEAHTDIIVSPMGKENGLTIWTF